MAEPETLSYIQPAPPQWLSDWADLYGYILVLWSPKNLYWGMIHPNGDDKICHQSWSVDVFLESLPKMPPRGKP